MVQLTVGYVAGFIAAGIFVARLWSPNTLTFILSGILRDKNSASTWTVASRAFYRSYWTTILQTDSSLRRGVRGDVYLLTKLISIMSALIAIAGVVTPLGLYEALLPASSTQASFQYLADTSPFGYGTPPRSNLSFNRLCNFEFWSSPYPCPFTNSTVITQTFLNDSAPTFEFPFGIDVNIPRILLDAYSSGTENRTTVSNFFDIQWRRYFTTSNEQYNNGSSYLVGSFRSVQSLILNNAFEAVEGLVVDTMNGGIGFRNHSFPPGFGSGVTWQEDLLFVEPETVCVNTNLTLDYSIPNSPNLTSSIGDVVLTDRGGFINLDHDIPIPDFSNSQENPDLYGRAYAAAWWNNYLTALYYNVTDLNNSTTGAHAFSYLNSTLNAKFPVVTQTEEGDDVTLFAGFQAFGISTNYGYGTYLSTAFTVPPNSSSLNLYSNAPPPNPFGISGNNFTDTPDINVLCTGAGEKAYANITNIIVACGLMTGIPQRQGEGSGLVFDSGSSWSQPMYSCATAAKATIKTVTFNYNGTSGSLSDLAITNIEDKSYEDESDIPLWGVENTGNTYMGESLRPIWGLVSDTYENNPNVSTVRQPSLYLPGLLFDDVYIDLDNIPGADFLPQSMVATYSVGTYDSSTTPQVDYTGQTNMAMWARWQNLTQSAETASLIPNLIFTDNAASAVVGTKGVLGPGNNGGPLTIPIFVTPTVLRIKYHYLFAIPALLVLLMLVLITLFAFITICFHGAGISRMRLHLQQVSPGRIYTTFLYPASGGMHLKTKEWEESLGGKEIDLSGGFPTTVDEMVVKAQEGDVLEGERLMSYREQNTVT